MTDTKQIVKNLKKYKPEKIILFGSHAWGEPRKDSDIDLLIIKKTKESHYKRIPEARKYLHGINQAFDILIMRPDEVEKRLKLGDFFIEEIIQKGKVLYATKK